MLDKELKNAANATCGIFKVMIGPKMRTTGNFNLRKFVKIRRQAQVIALRHFKDSKFGAQYGFYRGFLEFWNT